MQLPRWIHSLAFGTAAALMAMACSDSGSSDGGGSCTPGQQQACACPGGAPDGVQACASDGASFGQCDCGGGNENCGNGDMDPGEDCDDGNQVNDDGCTNSCGLPECGDGVVQDGEQCDDGGAQGELNTCPDDCGVMGGTGGSGSGGGSGTGGAGGAAPTCDDVTIFAGLVSVGDATTSYTGSPAWAYQGLTKLDAGNAMCAAKAVGSHYCTYEELRKAEAKPDADEPIMMNVANTTTIWVHRDTPETIDVNGNPMVGGTLSQPGAGGRCNDWEYVTNHISDGEYAVFGTAGAITYFLDNDTVFDMAAPGVHNAFTGQCGGTNRAIACCYPCND